MTIVHVAKDYTRHPAGRFKKDGPYNGETFRKRFLEPPLLAGERLTVMLDGVRGYGSSFLEEAFGGLIRAGLSLTMLRDNLVLQGDSGYVSEAWSAMRDAEVAARLRRTAMAH